MISVKDRLPTPGKYYIAWGKLADRPEDKPTFWKASFLGLYGWLNDSYEAENLLITHWMEIEPPEDDDE